MFSLLACAACYDYLFYDQSGAGAAPRMRAYAGWLRAPNTSVLVPADAANATTRAAVCATLDDDGCFRWAQCCGAAADCCRQQLTKVNGTRGVTWCPRTWDGYACWGDARPATTVYRPCPAFLPHVLPGGECDLSDMLFVFLLKIINIGYKRDKGNKSVSCSHFY